MRFLLLCLALLTLAAPARARDVYFTASDGARLHYTITGPPAASVLVFVPGWTMPGWIFAKQERAFAADYQVILFDPRGQGDSEVTQGGYTQARRAADIAELLARLPGRVVLIGWSLGVLDSLAYVHQSGQSRLAGLVLIDNSVGENPPPIPGRPRFGPVPTHAAYMRAFVQGMFHTPQPPAFLARLTAASLEMPQSDADSLLHYPVPRTFWKATLLGTNIPVLYIVRPHLRGQADSLLADRPNTQIAIFPRAGHALFIDDATRFNTLMDHFLRNSVMR